MANEPAAMAAQHAGQLSRASPWRRSARGVYSFVRNKPLGAAAAAIILLLVAAALIAPLITPHGDLEQVTGLKMVTGQIVMTTPDGAERTILRTLKPGENETMFTLQYRQQYRGAKIEVVQQSTFLKKLTSEQNDNPAALIESYRQQYPDAWKIELERLQFFPPGQQFWLGSDDLGRDVWTRVIYGSRISLQVGIIVTLIACTLGLFFGILSGYLMGWFDVIFQRFVDAMISLPTLILAMVLAGFLGAGLWKIILLLGIVLSPNTIRVVRATVLSIKENQFVDAARAIGCSNVRVMVVHIMPNVWASVLVMAGLLVGAAILVEASLSFLGFGIPPPTPSWGGMLSGAGRQHFQVAWWMAVFPGAALSLTVLGWNLLGDAVRDVMDPRLKGTGRH